MRNARLGPNSNFGEGDDHGTRLASLIAARGNDGTLMTGMMWRANLGLYEIQGTSVIDAVDAAFAAGLDGARVINLSQGINWHTTPSQANPAHVKTVDDVHQKFADALTDLAASSLEPLLVVSAGNDGVDARWNGTPLAKNDGFGHQIIVVGASNRQGGIWAGSNTGALVDVFAPGAEVYSLDSTGSVTAGSPGTSESAALVTGLAGLLLSFDSRMTSSDLKRAITAGATAGGTNGISIINAYESLKEAARTLGAPLCGNRTYLDGPSFYTQRTGGPEPLGTLDADTYSNLFSSGAFTGSIAVQHGGKGVLVCVGPSYCGEYLTFQNEAWTTTQTPPGEERVSDSGPRNSIHGLTHDGDSMATVTQTGTGSYAGVYEIRMVSVSTGQGRVVGTLASDRTYNFGMDVSVAPGGDFLLLMSQWGEPIPAPDNWAAHADLYRMSTATGGSSRLRTWFNTALLGAQIAEDGREAVLVVNGANTCDYEYISLPGGGTAQTVPSSISYCDRHESRATFLRGPLSSSLR